MIYALEQVSIAVSATRLAEAARAYATLLGRRAQQHPAGCSFQLSNVRLELVADAAAPGLAGLAFAVEDLEAWGRLLARRGLPVQPANLGDQSAPPALLADRQATLGVPMHFCAGEKEAVRPSTPTLPETETTAVTALDHLVIKTPNPDRAIALYAGRLGLSLRLDRSDAEWGARLLFFRCGALTVELVHRPGQESGEGVDRLWGLSWRVPDMAGAHARLRAAGVDLSEIRGGRRPGTRVATVRSHTAGVATLLIGPDAGA
ncbi:MAG TPA: VOC family protein [Hyphomicrobiaceae bacterium]|nr:VOC family protein [Hyphomicrobiaceae bacterium]